MNRLPRIPFAVPVVLATIASIGCSRTEQPASTTPSASVAVTTSCSAAASKSSVRALDTSGAGSTVALAAMDGATLAFVADEDDRAIHVIDVDKGEKLSTTLLEGEPSQLLLLKDGRLAVALKGLSQLQIFDTANPSSALPRGCTVATAAEPVSLAVTPDTATLLVTSDWGQTLGGYDTSTLERRFDVALGRSPRAVVVSDDGRQAFISHAAGSQMSVVDLAKHTVGTIAMLQRHDRSLQARRRQLQDSNLTPAQLEEHLAAAETMEAANARRSCQGFALAKSQTPGGRVLAPHVLVDPGQPLQRSSGYGEESQITEIPAVAVIDVGTATPLGESLDEGNPWRSRGNNGELQEDCILPRAAVVDDKSQTLLVSCFGIDSVVALDASSARPGDAELHRWRVASGPSGLAVDSAHNRAIVWSQFDRTLNTLDLSELDPMNLELEPPVFARLELEPTEGRELTMAERLGRRLFHATQDSRIASDGRACASCHPGGRDDGLVWSTPNGPRRSIMLAGRLEDTAPYGWGGEAADLERHLASTFKRLGGVGGLRSVDLEALVAYTRTLAPPPVAAGSDDPAVKRGAEIFASNQTGCASCHSGTTMTDNAKHDVGSRAEADRESAFETPSLRYIGARGPFFHDGRYASLEDLLRGTDGKMGKIAHLNAADFDALEAYLLSL